MIIDTHAHLMFPEFQADLEDVLKRAKNSGVEKIINVGCDLKSCVKSVEMASRYDFLYATLGMHPYEAKDVTEKLMEEWEEIIAKEKKIVAIGECGLDYFKAELPKEIQKRAFILQLELAYKTNLPVIIHNREADSNVLEILDDFEKKGKKVRAVFHCYGSNLKFAEELWKRGYLTGFTGIVTYPKAVNVKETAKKVPAELFLVETDCPYLAPQKFRGERNESSFVTEVVRELSLLKDMTFEEIAEASTANAIRFFGLAEKI